MFYEAVFVYQVRPLGDFSVWIDLISEFVITVGAQASYRYEFFINAAKLASLETQNRGLSVTVACSSSAAFSIRLVLSVLCLPSRRCVFIWVYVIVMARLTACPAF